MFLAQRAIVKVAFSRHTKHRLSWAGRGRERERERERGETEKLLALKFPRQCPIFLLVKLCSREGKRSEMDFVIKRGKKVSMISFKFGL